jgi:hypothetical protein
MANPIYFRDPERYQRRAMQSEGVRGMGGSFEQALRVIRDEERREQIELARMMAEHELLASAAAEDVLLGKSVGRSLGKTAGGFINAALLAEDEKNQTGRDRKVDLEPLLEEDEQEKRLREQQSRLLGTYENALYRSV